MAELDNLLKEGVAQLNIPLTQITLDRILLYVDYLAHWNQTYNLTAIKDKRDMIIKHVLDSLSLYPYLQGSRCIDVGTGPGLPGFMLALTLPEIEFVLLKINRLKFCFPVKVVDRVGLGNRIL